MPAGFCHHVQTAGGTPATLLQEFLTRVGWVWGSAATPRAVSGHDARPERASLLGISLDPTLLDSDGKAKAQGTPQVQDTRPAWAPQDAAVREVLAACYRCVTGCMPSIRVHLFVTCQHTCKVSSPQ